MADIDLTNCLLLKQPARIFLDSTSQSVLHSRVGGGGGMGGVVPLHNDAASNPGVGR